MSRDDFPRWRHSPEGRRFWVSWRAMWTRQIPPAHLGWWDWQHLMEKP